MSGIWHGSANRGPCVGANVEDWTFFTATLSQTDDAVSGEIVATGGARHPVVGTLSSGQLGLGVADLPNTSTCYAFGLVSTTLTHDSRGNLVAVSGYLAGRCCGTVAGSFQLTRVSGA